MEVSLHQRSTSTVSLLHPFFSLSLSFYQHGARFHNLQSFNRAEEVDGILLSKAVAGGGEPLGLWTLWTEWWRWGGFHIPHHEQQMRMGILISSFAFFLSLSLFLFLLLLLVRNSGGGFKNLLHLLKLLGFFLYSFSFFFGGGDLLIPKKNMWKKTYS